MKRVFAIMLAVGLAIQTSGCAYLFHGTSDQITINSPDPNAEIYLNDQLIGRGNASATVDRGKEYEIAAKEKGCVTATAQTGDKFDPVSLLGILIDVGIISILVIDMAVTDAAWKTYPLSYSVNPICPAPLSAPSAAPTPSASQS
jgi:hypothetical protein